MTAWSDYYADVRANRALFNELFFEDNPEMWDEFLKNWSPNDEASLFKGIPNNEFNRHLFLDLFRDMRRAGHFKGKRIKLMYRGPRDYAGRGRINAQSMCLQSEGTTFAVYLYNIKHKSTVSTYLNP